MSRSSDATPGDPATRQVVLGLGNVLNHDEGLGVYAVRALAGEVGREAGVEFVDGGVLGLDLLPLVEACSHLLLVDAVDAGQPPGALIELSRHEIPAQPGPRLSPHQVTFQDVLALAAIRGRLPPNLHLVGLQPLDLSPGVGLHPATAAMMAPLLQRVRAVLDGWAPP